MDEELKCAVCKQLFANPVLLPCYHSLCLNCAVQIQSPVHQQSLPASTNLNGHHSHASTTNFHGHSHHIVITTATVHQHHTHNSSSNGTLLHHGHSNGHHLSENSSVSSGRADSDKSSTSSQTSGGEDSSDKVSVLSETDSGVVGCSSSSRPNSCYSGSHHMHGLLFPPIQSTSFCLACPVCHKTVYFDENGASNLPKYRVMQNVVDKYVEARNLGTKCQMCEKNPKAATIMCEQCEIFYCETCRDACHPARGPLAKHSLINPEQGKVVLKQKAGPLVYKCVDHSMESLNMYCMLCKVPVCVGCLQEEKHGDHDVQPIQHMSKAQKVRASPFSLFTWSALFLHNTKMRKKAI